MNRTDLTAFLENDETKLEWCPPRKSFEFVEETDLEKFKRMIKTHEVHQDELTRLGTKLLLKEGVTHVKLYDWMFLVSIRKNNALLFNVAMSLLDHYSNNRGYNQEGKLMYDENKLLSLASMCQKTRPDWSQRLRNFVDMECYQCESCNNMASHCFCTWDYQVNESSGILTPYEV